MMCENIAWYRVNPQKDQLSH